MTPLPITAISARISSIESRFRPPGVDRVASTSPTGSAGSGAAFSDAYSAASATAPSRMGLGAGTTVPSATSFAFPSTVAVPWSQLPGSTQSAYTPVSVGAWNGVGAVGSTGYATPASPGSIPTGPAGQTLESLDARPVVAGTPYAELFDAAGQRHGVPPRLLASIGWVESRYNPNALSPDGAQGVMQLMPFVSEAYGADPHVPAQAIDAAAQLLSEHHDRFGNWELSVASYFSGAGAVSRAGNQPPTSRSHDYVRSVTERLPHV